MADARQLFVIGGTNFEQIKDMTSHRKNNLNFHIFNTDLNSVLNEGSKRSGHLGAANTKPFVCEVNDNHQAFICQASFELRQKANKKGPDEEELTKLANSVDEFSYLLLNPLKSDKKLSDAFADSLDDIMDAAIEMKQKKVRNQSFKT